MAHLNNSKVDINTLKENGVHTRAAQNIIQYRNGIDNIAGTEDDNYFDNLQELDNVYFVGPRAMEQLTNLINHRCAVSPVVDAIFSPQPFENSHLKKAIDLINSAQKSIDIAMYSFRVYDILYALENAIERGVKIRFIFNAANQDKNDPQGTMSAKLEEAGINVRYINKIMHHKFAIVDGPISSIDDAYFGTLITSSGNWSNSAGTRFDENTLIINGSGELLLRFQQEFNLIWENSRDLIWNNLLTQQSSMKITDYMVPNNFFIDSVFTSANFRIYESRFGKTFSLVSGKNAASDALVKLIKNAEESIYIASGHLRSKPISQAILDKQEENPEIDIRIYLDNQEYISSRYSDQQKQKLSKCLLESGESVSKQQKCFDKGYYYSYSMKDAEIPVKFKYYCYRWHYSYAIQMHHKYIIIDKKTVATGSYNYSDNAEHNTLENIVILSADLFPNLISSFLDNFDKMWIAGENKNLYENLLEKVQSSSNTFPIVFEPMALSWQKATVLKQAIRDNCTDINSESFRNNPQNHKFCRR